MSGEKKFLAANFQQVFCRCSLLVRTNVLGWNWIFWKIIEKFTFGSEANVFKFCQQSFVSIVKLPPTYPEEPFLEDIFREQIWVWFFLENEQKKAGFLLGRFPQICRNWNLSVESINSKKETVFEKIYIFFRKKISFGFWAKVLGILVNKLFLRGCCKCSKRVRNKILRKNLLSGKKMVVLWRFLILS